MNIIATIGDPNGIGIECLAKAIDYLIANCRWFEGVNIEISGNASIVKDYLTQIHYPFDISDDSLYLSGRAFKIHNICESHQIKFGETSKSAGAVAARAIEFALLETIAKKFDAMLTMPISKESIQLAGWHFPGHTEMIASACKVHNPLMLLFHNNIRVGLITTHTPLKDVSLEMTFSKIVQIATTLHHSLLKDFAIKHPRIAVLGINPHAGENGNIGREELEIIIPAMSRLKERGISTEGPFPADGFFGFGEYKKFDAILAMYHDQGLVPLKLLAEGGGVNFTAGLPIVRTSPDHGTAFAIAGKSLANPQSTIAAIHSAYQIFNNRQAANKVYL